MKKAVRFAGLSLILSAALGFTAPAEGVYTPGTYTATASGMGELSVSVTVDDSSIVDIAIDGANETPEIGGAALDSRKLPAAVLLRKRLSRTAPIRRKRLPSAS